MTVGGMRLVLLGPPGSGKGTQAERLAARLGVPAISTGDMVRAAMESGSELGRRIESIVNSGTLVDDETMADLVRQRLSEEDARSGFLLDGYPRTLSQADTLAGVLVRQSEELDGVLLIDVPEHELLDRLLARKRADDTKEVIQHRLDVYRRQTSPLIDHYRGLGLLREVNGHQSIDEVEATIVNALEAMGQEVV